MGPSVEGFFHEPTNSLTYLVHDPASRRAAILDPVLDYDARAGRTATSFIDRVIARAREQGLALDWILETHVHADHLSAAPRVRAELGGSLVIGRHVTAVQRSFKPIFGATDLAPDGSQFDRLVAEGDRLPLGTLAIEVLETPGHTPACVSYRVGDAVFVGDTFFMPDYGTARCDFPGGDAATLWQSLRKILALPDATRVFVCHDYKAPGRDAFAWETTVAAQRRNIHLRDNPDQARFVAFRQGRDKTLSVPALIIPAIQVNMRAGQLPPAEADGGVYLKVPVNRL
jgi:glyoxylase-like metal-dependent hydrolase (beta-lactamase superfamily II)